MLGIGVELSLIRSAYNPKADYANVTLVVATKPVWIVWHLATEPSKTTLGSDFEDLSSIVNRFAAGGQ